MKSSFKAISQKIDSFQQKDTKVSYAENVNNKNIYNKEIPKKIINKRKLL